jgi:glyoxylate reductase
MYYSPSAKKEFETKTGARKCDLDELLKKSDIISIHCPLNDQTKHLINSTNMVKIKKGAFLINTSRGPVVEESALAENLKNGHLGGAGLDVYEFEPEVYPELLNLNNVVLLPHIGSATKETRGAMAKIAAENVKSVLSGGKPLNPVW